MIQYNFQHDHWSENPLFTPHELFNPYAMDVAKVWRPGTARMSQLSDDWYAMDIAKVQQPSTAQTSQLSNNWYMGGNSNK